MHAATHRHFGINRMAKRRRINPARRDGNKSGLPSIGKVAKRSQKDQTSRSGSHGVSMDRAKRQNGANRHDQWAGPLVGLLAGVMIYLSYHPSDSVAVEQGDAILFCLLAILLTMGCMLRKARTSYRGTLLNERETIGGKSAKKERRVSTDPEVHNTNQEFATSDATKTSKSLPNGVPSSEQHTDRTRLSQCINWSLSALPWILGAWMMLSAFATSPPGNLRDAMNEAWLWVAAACVFHSSRSLLSALQHRRAIIALMLTIASGLAVHGLHQYFISLPQNRAQYLQDPEAVLQLAGIEAPAGSSERMIFENRLMDGGPSATFALANSLAGYLLAAVVFCVSIFALSWREQKWLHRFVLGAVALLCISCLLATRSRTATVAMLASFGLIVVLASGFIRSRRRYLLGGLAILAGIVVVGLGYLSIYGNREWFEQAPASVAFRLQYWRSTWQLALESPWFGSGPGNFQAVYERYREAAASEQIAEPHHFLMETLATGGFPALLVVVTLGVAVLIQYCSTSRIKPPSLSGTAATQTVNQNRTHAPWLGAIIGLLAVWILGIVTLELPDISASLLAIPICIAVAPTLSRAFENVSSEQIDLSTWATIAALLLHLSMSGGWTVPGLAIWIWLTFGILARENIKISEKSWVNTDHSDSQDRQSPRVRWGVWIQGGSLAVLFAFFWLTAFRPQQKRNHYIAEITLAQQSGSDQSQERLMREWLESDRWAPGPAIWLSDFYRWRLIYSDTKDASGLRTRWLEAIDQIRKRSGQDPSVERIIGIQAIHLFQRWGRPTDLKLAEAAFERASEMSPSSEWLYAQLSSLAAREERHREAKKLADKAIRLSQLGNNIERDLKRQLIYLPDFIGFAVRGNPQRIDAATLLEDVRSE